MDCAEEAAILRRELSSLQGVQDLSFDVVRAKMVVDYAPAATGPDAIAEAVSRTGMKAEPWSDQPMEQGNWWRRHSRGLLAWFSGLAVAAAMLDGSRGSSNILLAVLAHHHDGAVSWHQIALFLISIAAGLYYSLPKAWAAVRDGRADMNVLMVISVAGAVTLGEWAEAATVAFLFALANLLESWSMGRARHAVQALLDLSPKEATLLHHDHEHRVPVEKLNVDDLIHVRPGERIPTDGIVTSGRSAVDQALLTGECVPILKSLGDEVFAGTINGDGALTVRVTRPASDTTLARILRMVEDSQRRRTHSEQWVERFATRYTPIMIAVAVAVAVFPPLFGLGTWNEWFYRSMVILLTSCPCALVISTPVTMVAALTSAAKNGILVKGGIFLEVAATAQAIAFDKTGVLTHGEPEVTEVLMWGDGDRNTLISRIAGLEHRSEHPLARAVVRFAERERIPLAAADQVEALPGRGTTGRAGGESYWIGSSRLLEERSLMNPEVAAKFNALTVGGHTVVAAGSGDRVLALLAIQDQLRPEAADTLQELRRLGFQHLVMLTGDYQQVAEAVASELPLDEVHARLLPEDKAARVRALKQRYQVVAMVGDGINDTQAIATASLGIAIGTKATDVALETADVVLMRNDLRQLPQLFRHAKRALGVVKQNVVFALGTKAIFLIMASLGLATLWMAVAADMGATFLVTLNGLRLLRQSRLDD